MMNKNNRGTISDFRLFSIGLLSLFLNVPVSLATSVLAVDVDQMLKGSELVFEGRVVETNVRRDPHKSRMIKTHITFEVLDILKGQVADRYIELKFLGGKIGNRSLVVEEMDIPPVGERGVYFVEKQNSQFVQPFYGWSQGRFLVEMDPQGVERVTTFNKRPVEQIQSAAPTLNSDIGKSIELSTGVARGVQLVPKDGLTSDGISLHEFKQDLQSKLKGAQ